MLRFALVDDYKAHAKVNAREFADRLEMGVTTLATECGLLGVTYLDEGATSTKVPTTSGM